MIEMIKSEFEGLLAYKASKYIILFENSIQFKLLDIC